MICSDAFVMFGGKLERKKNVSTFSDIYLDWFLLMVGVISFPESKSEAGRESELFLFHPSLINGWRQIWWRLGCLRRAKALKFISRGHGDPGLMVQPRSDAVTVYLCDTNAFFCEKCVIQQHSDT